MNARTRIVRVLIGLVVLVIIVIIGFAVAQPAITRWGATDEEAVLALPGDEMLANPSSIGQRQPRSTLAPIRSGRGSRRSATRAAASTVTPSSKIKLAR